MLGVRPVTGQDDDTCKWRDVPKRLLFEAPQRELFRKYPALRQKSIDAIKSSCAGAMTSSRE